MKVTRARYKTFRVKKTKRMARDRGQEEGQAITLGEKVHVERRPKDKKFKKEINMNPKSSSYLYSFFYLF